jgi:peptide/nickel transport system ATP-binding protein
MNLPSPSGALTSSEEPVPGGHGEASEGGSGTAHLREREDIVLRIEHLTVEFPAGAGATVHAVSDLSFDIAKGETLGLVGESGCGKSTTGRAIMQLPRPTAGSVLFQGKDLTALRGDELRRTRTHLQMIFQDPISSLNPRRKIKDIVGEGLRIWEGTKARHAADRIDRALSDVGLDPETVGDRRPHQFSGGQCQRICLARSLVLDPEVLICDEPVSALDVSVQAQILNLLEAMKARYQLTMVFIAHDLAVVKNISDRVAVMYLGKLCELAPAATLYRQPAHPYTRALLASIPKPSPGDVPTEPALGGELPSPLDPPSGCRFRTRCARAQARCASEEPRMRAIGSDHFVACHFPHTEGSKDTTS